MKDLTVSAYSFENMIRDGFLYVDKTEYLWNLVKPRMGMYFLSHPRRFGKSLTLSTLKSIFQGKRDLFKGLAIHNKPYDWRPYPIIHLNFADCAAQDAKSLVNYLDDAIKAIAAPLKIALTEHELPSRFSSLIASMDAGQGVVILVDEYDKPILNNVTSPNAKELLAVLKGFYSAIKASNQHERFVFITGVTKFCHVSLFSDLNNLMDITMDADYATMLGYTQNELETNFAEWIKDVEKLQELPHEDFLAEIKSWYDGYRFHPNAERVYNPVSLAYFFKKHGEFSNYWFETGTPTFLMELIKQRRTNLAQVVAEQATLFSFGSFEIDNIPPLTLLLQTGYLTIKSANSECGQTMYCLDFPNREVSESFNVCLLDAYTKATQNGVANFCWHLNKAISCGDLPMFQKTMEVFFSNIPYDVHHKDEANFQNIFFAIFKLLGINIQAESRTSDGRIDAIIETESNIYLFEFKLDKDKTALTQMMTKEYFKPYLLASKKITLVGVNFDTETGRLSEWKSQEVN